jgi:hypothetical protein
MHYAAPKFYRRRQARCAVCGDEFEKKTPCHKYCAVCAAALCGLSREERQRKIAQLKERGKQC